VQIFAIVPFNSIVNPSRFEEFPTTSYTTLSKLVILLKSTGKHSPAYIVSVGSADAIAKVNTPKSIDTPIANLFCSFSKV